MDILKKLILFIHGLGGDEETWGIFPKLISKDKELDNFNIEIYTYPTSIVRPKSFVSFFSKPLSLLIPQEKLPKIQDIAEALKTEIESRYKDYGEIYLITHSMGGLVAKQYLMNEINLNIKYLRIKKLLLYAVPNNGSKWALLSKLYKHEQIEQLGENSDFIEFINKQSTMLDLDKYISMKYVIGTQDEVVDKQSGQAKWGNEKLATVHKNHMSIVKPINKDDTTYIIFKDFILDKKNNVTQLSHNMLKKIKEMQKKKGNKKMDMLNNLPDRPYRKFYGRKDSIIKIKDVLLDGSTFIVSIDGIGGIGKTALAYYFCETVIAESNFEYVVWITAKNTVFDSYASDVMTKQFDDKFRGIETLIDETLLVAECGDYINTPYEEKKDFFELLIKTSPIFFIFDNLETIEDSEFFSYIRDDFNKFSNENRELKILTTSRKRKEIIDYPIKIDGLPMDDALDMLKDLAQKFNIKDILNSNDHDNKKLVEKVGGIPIAIEYIIGQMRAKKKNRGEIYEELKGCPVINDNSNVNDKKMTEIISFIFKDMYESLNDDEHYFFKTIVALEKNINIKKAKTNLKLLTRFSVLDRKNLGSSKILEILEKLVDNRLIDKKLEKNENTGEKITIYSTPILTINFATQYYSDFEKFENNVIEKRDSININKNDDAIEIALMDIDNFDNPNKAKDLLIKLLETDKDYRLYFKLAQIQEKQEDYVEARENFKIASKYAPQEVNIWINWIQLLINNGSNSLALNVIEEALEKTEKNISIALFKLKIYEKNLNYTDLRNLAYEFMNLYKIAERNDELKKLLYFWRDIEKSIDFRKEESHYLYVSDELYYLEDNSDERLKIREEQKRVLITRKANGLLENDDLLENVDKKIIEANETILRSLHGRVKEIIKSSNITNNIKSSEIQKEAKIIIKYIDNYLIESEEFLFDNDLSKDDLLEMKVKTLETLFIINNRKKEFSKTIELFNKNKELCTNNVSCTQSYNKSKREIDKVIIPKIVNNMNNILDKLQNLIINSLDGNEMKLRQLVKNKGKLDWIDEWSQTRKKSLNYSSLIKFSDLYQLLSLLKWCEDDIINLSIKHSNIDITKSIIIELEEELVTIKKQQQNKTFVSYLQSCEQDALNIVDFMVENLVLKFNDLDKLIILNNEETIEL